MNSKTVAVMQPYFLPYIGYLHLVHASDIFVHFDDVQFQRKSWMHRNRIISKGSLNPFYLNAPIEKSDYACQYSEVRLKHDYKSTLKAGLNGYNKALFKDSLETLIDGIPSDIESLVDFNIYCIETIARKIGYMGEFVRSSELELWWNEKPEKGTWGFKIAKELKATNYLNAIGGESFILPENSGGLRLGFIESKLSAYPQRSGSSEFIAGLSIVDIIANTGYDGLKELVNNYCIKWKN